ncbi:hypothetical protein SISSUDRAFT_456734 [Sistotremastrum suecicum HHB10207 ss-3]|uniref:Exocyst complex component Sec8 n=1 Tax=Sistotremastrum suecicum HHB10207 ss-3 TaxID=1314776 RepID=A0A165Y7J4_9AGAM|nr:hypothetical protein SISSUDRAFT_456734 [Sistotremastrum suecicum HHB10207 ss-3]
MGNSSRTRLDLALSLIDPTTSLPSPSLSSFQRTKSTLSKALKSSVDTHYKPFAASLDHHASLLSSFKDTQSQISETRNALVEAKEMLGSKRADLVQLWSRGQVVDEMLKMLDQIEWLKSVPDTLESLLSEKRLLLASILLIKSLKIINTSDMHEIGAVSDLRSYLQSQEISLREILIEELHAHLYLKSFWCESRWAPYTFGQTSMPVLPFDQDPSTTQAASGGGEGKTQLRLFRYLHDLHSRPNEPPYSSDDLTSTLPSSSSTLPNTIPSSLPSTFSLDPSTSRTSLTSLNPSSSNPSASAGRENPESDSFAYIESLLESLAVLGKLGVALEVVSTRLQGEVWSLVEGTLDEIGERGEFVSRMSLGGAGTMGTTTLGTTAMGGKSDIFILPSPPSSSPCPSTSPTTATPSGFVNSRLRSLSTITSPPDQETLKDLFWTIYSKLDAVLQGLRVVGEVGGRIGSRRSFKEDTSLTSTKSRSGAEGLFPLMDQWLHIQAEMRTLLSEYLVSESERGVGGGGGVKSGVAAINDVLRGARERGVGGREREREKVKVFRFADSDFKSMSKAVRGQEEELLAALRGSVPGLVHSSSEPSSLQVLSTTTTSTGISNGISETKAHRLLLPPTPFHIPTLFPPSLAFLDRVVEVMPSGLEPVRTASLFLDEFVKGVWMGVLEERVSGVFHSVVAGPEAFLEDPLSTSYSSYSPTATSTSTTTPSLTQNPTPSLPLLKSFTHTLALINSLTSLLLTTPFHREDYSRLILGVVAQFYSRVSDFFRDVVERDGAHGLGVPLGIVNGAGKDDERGVGGLSALGAQWAHDEAVFECLSSLLNASDENAYRMYCEKENELELALLGQGRISADDILPSGRDLRTLCALYRSITWLVQQLTFLKPSTESQAQGVQSPSGLPEPSSTFTPYTPQLPTLTPFAADEQLVLPLTREMSVRFSVLLKTYQQLADIILFTVRIDIRVRTIRQLDQALRRGNYRLERDGSDPDEHIIDLNVDLAKCDDATMNALPEKQRLFIFNGLGTLIESVLISHAKIIPSINTYGLRKMTRNILALTQNLKTIREQNWDTDMERVKRYWGLYALGPQGLLATIRHSPSFSFDEYKTMLAFQCGVDPSSPDTQSSNKDYNEYLIDLYGLLGEVGPESR